MANDLTDIGDAKFQSIFAYAPLGMALVDVRGHPILNNQALQNILGYSEEELQHMAFPEFTHPEDVDKDLELYQQLIAGQIDSYKMEKRYIRKDGEHVWAQLTVSSIKSETGDPVYAVGMVSDITETRAIQHHVAQAQKMEALSTLAGGIAHDFNNILAAISGHAELGLEQSENSELIEHLQTILKSADRAAALIQQVLTFSSQESSNITTVELKRTLQDSLKLITATVPHNINIDTIFEVDHAPVVADTTQIHQILVNLCVNASHAINGAQSGEIEIRLSQQGADFVISVKDNGHGMSADTLQRMFDPFYTTKRIGKGAGLGLAVVDRLVRQHSGHIDVSSAEGHGTKVAVFFPAAKSQIKTPAKKSSVRSLEGRVLVADDEPDLLKLYEAILTELGLIVVCCNDGAEALKTFEETAEPFDLVITDQSMPFITGKELTTKIHAIDPEIPVILSTGYSDILNESEAENLGAAGFFRKPFRRHTVAQVVSECLSR